MIDILLHYFFISCGGQKKTVLLTGADTEYEKIKELIIDGEISASSFCEINKGNCGAQLWFLPIINTNKIKNP